MSSLSFAAEWRRFALRVEELREQLEVEEEEEGKEDGQEEEEEVDSGEGRVKERQPCGWTMDGGEKRLSQKCECDDQGL